MTATQRIPTFVQCLALAICMVLLNYYLGLFILLLTFWAFLVSIPIEVFWAADLATEETSDGILTFGLGIATWLATLTLGGAAFLLAYQLFRDRMNATSIFAELVLGLIISPMVINLLTP